MWTADLNLLLTLDVLLAEGSVARAARRLGLSPSAMSRALARLRAATGDPLLVRAGRGLVPTPRALELRARTGPLMAEARAILSPVEAPDLERLTRTFTLRTREGFVETFGLALLDRIAREAPGVRLHFLPKPDKDSAPLREGDVDLEIGVLGRGAGPEVRMQALFPDRFVGVVREGHALTRAPVTLDTYLAGAHVGVSRRGRAGGPFDDALAGLGRERRIATLVAGFPTALALARESDLIATVPERSTGRLRDGMHSFALPFAVADFTVSLFWHPRLDADPVHRWLRGCIREVCGRP